jgi:adenine-specific DNA-methyltransferase
MDKMKMESVDMTAQNIDKIGAMFPNCITETVDANGKPKKAVNFELLKQMLSDKVLDGDEAYEFTWVGKKAAIVEANKPIRKTLRPCPKESKNWDTTENLYIEGDNLEVLKLLQESYLGKVKMIYIDPPYNTGNDFIYNDDFKMTGDEYAGVSGVTDENGNRMFKNIDTNGRFHSDWCSMIYSRLMLARNLLTDDGVIFISIDDNEVDNLRKICDEVYGNSNRIAEMVWQTTPGSNTGINIITVTEYILVYARAKNLCKFNTIVITDDSKYILEDEYVLKRGRYILNKLDRRMTGIHYSEALNYPIQMPDGQFVYPGSTLEKNNDGWNYRWSKTKVDWGKKNGFLVFKNIDGKWNAYFKQYFKVDNNDMPIKRSIPYQNLITLSQFNSTQGTKEIMNLFGKKYFDYPKPSELILYILSICQQCDDIVLDFFSGSATTAHAVMQLNAEDNGNRKFIMVQLPEKTDEKSEAYKAGYKTICEIGKERIRRAGDKIKSETGADIDYGFRVLKLDDSNMTDVYYSADEYNQDLLSVLESNVKTDRSDLDLLFSCLLDWGLPLSMPYKSEQIEGCTVHTYNDGDLIACFDEDVPDSVVKTIAKRQPLRAVFRDSSFANSPAKINVTEIFKLLAPDTRVKVI